MGADSPRKRTQQPAWKAAAGAADDRRGPQYKWKPADAGQPGTGKRRLLQLLLLGGTLATLAGIVWLILYLWPTPQVTLIAVSADPARDADRLDVPLDLYGWRTAQEFLALGQEQAGRSTRWVGKPSEPPTDEGNPLRLPDTEAGLSDWANRLKNFDPLVIYVGLHGGVGADGQPFLFTGGGNRLPVAALLTTLSSDPLRTRKKVLIFDCSRLAPDPVYGQIHDGFSERVKMLNDRIVADPNLVVMCGASPGQRGWESEELRLTSFGNAILRGLRGEVDTGGANVITARALFESAARKTREWAQNNRPYGQDPFLLPEGDVGLARAAVIDLGPRPTPPPEVAPTPAALPESLGQLWQQHDDLAARTPSPAAYSPRAWRRYRELLLRYEQAVRLGEQQTATRLTTALNTAKAEIERAAIDKLDSARNSLALLEVASTSETDLDQMRSTNRLLGQLAASGNDPNRLAERLASTAGELQRRYQPGQRPVEVHLPVMVRDFYAEVLRQSQPALPAQWATAFAVRVEAERAAAGLPIEAPADPRALLYPERGWLITRHLVLAGDAKRREAEDKLFASDANLYKEAAGSLDKARQYYKAAAELGAITRFAFEVRDAVMADLPFLTRWYGERKTSAKDAADLIDLWEKTHKLAVDLDDLAAKPPAADTDPKETAAFIERVQAVGTTARVIKGQFDKCLTEFRDEAARARDDAALQKEWWDKQLLLTVPLIPAATRETVLKASRQESSRLLAGQQSQKPVSESAADARKSAEVRGKLARAALGKPLLDAQHEVDKTLPEAAILDRDLTLIATTADPGQWTGPAAQVGAGLGDHLSRLSAATVIPSPIPDQAAERLSRSAVPFASAAGWEPAAVNHRLRWRVLLLDLALRIADDHWYDELKSPYFKVAVDRLIKDADRMSDELAKAIPAEGSGTWVTPLPMALTARLSAPPLAAKDLPKFTWTSDLARVVQFGLDPPPDGYPVTGDAIGLLHLDRSDSLLMKDTGRSLLQVPAGPLSLTANLQLAPNAKEVTEPNCEVSAVVYFRGQRPTQRVRIDLRRKPELVIADPPPDDAIRGPAVAVRADRDLELGSVVILLDYSGSMNATYKGKSRKDAALDAVAALLKELPRGTPLRIRVFSDSKEPSGSRVIFGTGGGARAEVTWESDQDQRYKDLIATLRGIEPQGFTPLVQSIIDAAKSDFTDLSGGSKTLLVLTDGAEDDGQKRDAAGWAAFIDTHARKLANEMEGENVSLHVVQFALSSAELKQSADLFRPLLTRKPEQVRLWPAENDSQLLQALLDAIRPKLRLTDRRDELPDGFPRTGWPSRPADRRDPPYDSAKLHWTPRITIDRPRPYKASATPARVPSRVELDLRNGELMILGFGRDGGAVRIRRELYADYITRGVKARRTDEEWALSVPDTAIDDEKSPPEFHSLAFLEQVPPHRRGRGDRSAEVGALAFAHPDLTWWQVTPVMGKGEDRPSIGTVRVTRHYGYPAPGWEVRIEDWPHRPARPAEFKVWAADPAPGATFETVRPGDRRELTTPTGDKLQMSAEIETWPAAGAECLVVRFAFEKGRPVLARPSDLIATYAEHRYYGDGVGADGMIAYTAIFRLPEEALRTSGVRLKLIPVQPSRTDDNLLTLTPPEPRRGKWLDLDALQQPSNDPGKK
jgi:hypothetical protein